MWLGSKPRSTNSCLQRRGGAGGGGSDAFAAELSRTSTGGNIGRGRRLLPSTSAVIVSLSNEGLTVAAITLRGDASRSAVRSVLRNIVRRSVHHRAGRPRSFS